MEIWDIYDVDRIKTGKTMVRGREFKSGDYHLVVHVCIFNSDGQMLIQQRQPFKEGWPNLWDITVGGSAVSGDNSQLAAEREVLEEIGYAINLSNTRPALTIHFEDGFDDIYLVEDNLAIEDLTLQPEEVQAVKWATKEDILDLIDQGAFIPYHTNFIGLLFDLKTMRGAHKK